MLGKQEDEEDKGPSVESNDIEDRIAARRLRIQKRIEVQRREERGENLDEKPVEVVISKSRKQIEQTRQRLSVLLRDGNNLFSNVRVAADARETKRRTDDEEVRRLRTEKLETEAKTAMERFEEITKKWEMALQKDIPQDLHEMLQQQNELCQNMLEEKNKLITELQMELKNKNERYIDDLKKQSDDIDLMVKRMENFVKTVVEAYRHELIQIEKSFIAQRDDLMENQSNEWEEMMQAIRDKQEDYLKARDARVEDFESQLHDLRVKHAEEFNEIKIKLENDVEVMDQQIQTMKATYQLNLEKLEYNLQVLKKREEENTLTKSQQKRRITRLQDVLNNLRIKFGKQETQFRGDNEKATEDYKRDTEKFRDLQKKSQHLLAADAKKFQEIWLMNEAELKSSTQRLIDADRVIQEQQLGLIPEEIDTSFMTNVGPVLSDSEKARVVSAKKVAEDIIQSADGKRQTSAEVKPDALVTDGISALGPNMVKTILELLCEESDFLIEDKLRKLLQPLDPDEQSLMRLDAVFTALGVKSEVEIQRLVPYFIDLVKMDSPTAAEESATNEEVESEISDVGAEVSIPQDRAVAHMIHPNDVVKAILSYVAADRVERGTARGGRSGHQQRSGGAFTLTGLDERDASDDTAYWQSYSAVISEDKKLAWEALHESLESYGEILSSRANLLKETDALKQQNSELRHLLQQYVSSKVNQELHIPPTRVMQLNHPQ